MRAEVVVAQGDVVVVRQGEGAVVDACADHEGVLRPKAHPCPIRSVVDGTKVEIQLTWRGLGHAHQRAGLQREQLRHLVQVGRHEVVVAEHAVGVVVDPTQIQLVFQEVVDRHPEVVVLAVDHHPRVEVHAEGGFDGLGQALVSGLPHVQTGAVKHKLVAAHAQAKRHGVLVAQQHAVRPGQLNARLLDGAPHVVVVEHEAHAAAAWNGLMAAQQLGGRRPVEARPLLTVARRQHGARLGAGHCRVGQVGVGDELGATPLLLSPHHRSCGERHQGQAGQVLFHLAQYLMVTVPRMGNDPGFNSMV